MAGAMEALRIERSRTGLWAVVRLTGELDVAALSLFQQEIERVCAEDAEPRLIVDLSRVAFMDSCGLGGLVRAWKQVSGRGGRFVLVGVRDRVRELLRLTGMTNAFEIRDDLAGFAGE